MAISVNGGGNGRGFGSRRHTSSGTLAEINVTPFVDVVLVLLVIFMLTAHVMQFGLDVNVPKTRAVADTAKELPVISIPKTGDVYLNGKMIRLVDLKQEITQRFGGKVKGVYVMADRETIWDPIAQVTAELGAAGFQVNMVTQPEDSPKSRR
jgi:biopolymer transport protein ExbD